MLRTTLSALSTASLGVAGKRRPFTHDRMYFEILLPTRNSLMCHASWSPEKTSFSRNAAVFRCRKIRSQTAPSSAPEGIPVHDSRTRHLAIFERTSLATASCASLLTCLLARSVNGERKLLENRSATRSLEIGRRSSSGRLNRRLSGVVSRWTPTGNSTLKDLSVGGASRTYTFPTK